MSEIYKAVQELLEVQRYVYTNDIMKKTGTTRGNVTNKIARDAPLWDNVVLERVIMRHGMRYQLRKKEESEE